MASPTSPDPLAESLEILLPRLLREEWRDDLTVVEHIDHPSNGVLVGAATALGAGEPRRAIRLLDRVAPDADPNTTEVSRAFRALASTLDTEWFPGGDSGAREADRFPELPVVPNPDRAKGHAARVLVTTAWRFLGALPGWRSLVTNPGFAPGAHRMALQVLAEFTALDEMRAAAAGTLAAADLLAR